jgi:UDP-N-acetylmuramoyl-L-alanyl-D-glutamate--2,6-diaminopimelate ligase
MSLGELLGSFAEVPAPWANLAVTGLASDSRNVQPGDLFFAVRGGQRHGLEFLATVKAAGAVAVVWEPPWDSWFPVDDALPLLAAPELRQKMGLIASRFYGEPSRRLQVIGITGTDGKTSCAHFLAQALSDAESGPCGILGTLGVGVHGQTEPSLHTTPDPLAVQRWLADLVAKGRWYAAMEASSHALDQGRVNGIAFTAAVLTQLSRDHLDYHGTLDAYAAAKRRLFVEHQPDWAVLNLDDAFGQRLVAEAQVRRGVIAYGLGARTALMERFVWGEHLELTASGLRLHIESSWGQGELQAGLLGRFNASNLLATLATLLALDMPFDEALTRLARTATVPGRMERLGGESGQPLTVIDYAHTPHALEQVLNALREHGGRNRLWCVFGCGGDRDPGKRPLMGAAAERWADRVIVTDDNPRTEDPERIVSGILAGMQRPEAATVIRDRRAAIFHALAEANAGDMVLIAGKGHEDYQIVGTERFPFSDREAAHEFLYSNHETP